MKARSRWYRAPSGLLKAAVAALVVVAAILLVSCGGGDGEGSPTPPPEARPPGTATPGVGSPSSGAETPSPGSGALPTVDPNVSLVEFRSPEKGYSFRHPEGWEVDASPGAATDLFTWMDDGRRLALLQVTCNREIRSADSLMMVDADFASNFGGSLDLSAAVPVQVGGVDGIRNRYSISIGGGRIEHVVAYLAAGDCGWRIGLNSYGSGTLEPYLPLFQRILETFHFD